MGLVQAVVESLQKVPNKVVSRDAETELTGAQLLGAARAAAGRLSAPGTGGLVGLLMPSCAVYPAAIFGTIWAGKVAVPLNPMLKPNELDFVLKDAGIDTVVTVELTRPLTAGLSVKTLDVGELVRFAGAAPAAPAAVGDHDVAMMLYTSGTSGKPKGVPLTHDNLLGNARALITRENLRSDEVILSVLPMFHSLGLTATMMIPMVLGAEVNYLPRFTPERAAAFISERKVTMMVGVPGMFGLLARSKQPDESFASLRLPVCGGEALPGGIREAWKRRFGRDLLEGYGLTETSPVISVNIPSEIRYGTVGRVLPGVKVRIMGEDGKVKGVNEDGEIQATGPTIFKGYHNRPDENAASFTADGWFRTGDQGRLDADGYLSITGRIKELIIRGGEKIMPREVEEVLCRVPGVMEAAVIGEPDGDRGEAVVAFVVPAPGGPVPTPEAVREYARAHLAEFKVPRRVTIATDLPRGATGKILKRALKEMKPS